MNKTESAEQLLNDKDESVSLKEIFISFIILFLLLVTWYTINDYDHTFENAQDDGMKTTKIASLQVHSVFEQIRNVLIVISSELNDSNLKHLKTDGLNRYLLSRSMLISDIDSLLLTDKAGKVLAISYGKIPENLLNNFNFFKELKAINTDQLIYSEPMTSITSDEIVSAFAHRATNSNNEFNGIILANVPLSLWYNNFRQLKISENEEINIVNLRNCSILGTTTKIGRNYKSKNITSDFCKKHIQDQNQLFFSKKNSDTQDVISYVILPEFKIAVVTYSSHRDFLIPFYKKIGIILLSATIIFIGYWQLIKSQIATEDRLREKKIQMINSSKMATLGEMASGIAHEINNPLAIIKGRLQQALRTLKKENEIDVASLEKSISTALIATDRINHIVAGMKSISRESANDTKEKVSLDRIFSNTMIFCQEKLKNNNINFELAPIPNVLINCKETQVSQVILNLINNASDAIENFENKWVRINFELDEETKMIKMFFTDSGNGIPVEVLNKIMQPFFTTKPIGKGTGLGLSISSRIIKEHGGSLNYNYESAHTQFIITLPYVHA